MPIWCSNSPRMGLHFHRCESFPGQLFEPSGSHILMPNSHLRSGSNTPATHHGCKLRTSRRNTAASVLNTSPCLQHQRQRLSADRGNCLKMADRLFGSSSAPMESRTLLTHKFLNFSDPPFDLSEQTIKKQSKLDWAYNKKLQQLFTQFCGTLR